MNISSSRVVTPVAQPQIKQPLEALGRVVGTQAAQTFQPRQVLKDVRIGVVSSVPSDALFASQKYRRGEVKANEYAAEVLNSSMGFGAWTVAAAGVGALLAPIGLPAFAVGVAGFAAGMVANEVWNRTVGPSLKRTLAGALPEKGVKPIADVFTKWIANPLHDYVWKPVSGFVMKHKVISGAAVAALALKFPTAAKAIGKELGTMAGGTAAALSVNHTLLDKVLPAPKEEKPASTASALGELDARIQLDERASAYVRQRYAQQIDWQGITNPQLASDMEKLFYIKMLSESTSDAETAQTLSALFEQAADQVEAAYGG